MKAIKVCVLCKTLISKHTPHGKERTVASLLKVAHDSFEKLQVLILVFLVRST